MTESDLDKRRRAIWDVYWKPGLVWYPLVADVAKNFGVTRQTVHAVKRWAVRNGLPVRAQAYVRYTLSPHDALEMCRRLWGPPEIKDPDLMADDIIAEYGIATRTAYDVYRPRFASGELQAQVDAFDKAWREGSV